MGQLEGGVKFLVDMRASTIEFARSIDPNDVKCKNGLRWVGYFFCIPRNFVPSVLSVHAYVCSSVPICLSVYLSVFLCVYLSVCISICATNYRSAMPVLCLSSQYVYCILRLSPFLSLSIYLCIYVILCVSLSMSFSLLLFFSSVSASVHLSLAPSLCQHIFVSSEASSWLFIWVCLSASLSIRLSGS
jgi:hypothetical protein